MFKYCPQESSSKNIGIPAQNKVNKYGIRKAPKYKEYAIVRKNVKKYNFGRTSRKYTGQNQQDSRNIDIQRIQRLQSNFNGKE